MSELKWMSGTATPKIADASCEYFAVAVRRGHSGKTYTFTAVYLNKYGLEYEDCKCSCEEEHGDGCPTTGWFTVESSNQYDGGLYTHLLSKGDELVAWAAIPEFDPTELEAGNE